MVRRRVGFWKEGLDGRGARAGASPGGAREAGGVFLHEFGDAADAGGDAGGRRSTWLRGCWEAETFRSRRCRGPGSDAWRYSSISLTLSRTITRSCRPRGDRNRRRRGEIVAGEDEEFEADSWGRMRAAAWSENVDALDGAGGWRCGRVTAGRRCRGRVRGGLLRESDGGNCQSGGRRNCG